VLDAAEGCCHVTLIGKRQAGYLKKVGRLNMATGDRCQFHRQNQSADSRLQAKKKNAPSDALPFGGLWYAEPDAISNAIGYASFQPFT
jgi:hypothetical protein